MKVRRLVVVLGDQLDVLAGVLQGFDPVCDLICMVETRHESTHVPSSKMRTALFLSAMRHFAQTLRAKGWRVNYQRIDDADASPTLNHRLQVVLKSCSPLEVHMTAPGEWRVLQDIQTTVAQAGLALQLHDDSHFYTTVRDFAQHARGRKQLRMEFWYRELRQRFGVLMEGKEPVGGQWNFDADNRASFGKKGPGLVPPLPKFPPDEVTREVIEHIQTHMPELPGHCDMFDWPVTREQALQALTDFVEHRLPLFGLYEDAMWMGEPWLYHSKLSAAMNLKLIGAREVVEAVEQAYQRGHAPLAAAEGFIRQVLGWREYVRGVYWLNMPHYLELNALQATHPLPQVYWDANSEMVCVKEVVEQTLRLGYAHHIQRLMVTGLYALLLGVKPQAVHAWYLGVYVDAVEWVELPNTLGMSQYADGGIMSSKPYVASGKYIDRMSNYCKGCRYDPSLSTGEQACPMNTLYWDFLIRHEDRLSRNPRMGMQVRNAQRLSEEDRERIQTQAQQHRQGLWPSASD
jgi:deoxyribodipyrimidine photolyase-related protein